MKNKVIAMVLTASMLAASITGCARESEKIGRAHV